MQVSLLREKLGLLLTIAVVLVVGAVALATSGRWLPAARSWLAGLQGGQQASDHHDNGHHEHDGHDHEGHDHADHGMDPDVLELSEQARETLGIKVARLVRSDYARPVRIPGEIVKIAGISQQSVTSQSSGEITKIYVLQGQAVQPGEPLFDIRLTHEEAIQTQLELLDALAKMEAVNAEIVRLEELEEKSPGAVPGTRLLKQQYERRHLEHTIGSRRQILRLLGLSERDIEALVLRHKSHHETMGPVDDEEHTRGLLLEKLTIHAPVAEEPSPGAMQAYVMETLAVHRGQHVDVGTLLCRLGDYRRLHIVGQAFEQNLELVHRALDQGWTVSAAVVRHDGSLEVYDDMPILYVDPEVDPDSRSARFYVELENLQRQHSAPNGRAYADWRFRPGQRVEVRVPVERFEDALVVPAEAVAREGLENYVFQVSGNMFVRRKVAVQYRDKDRVVLSNKTTLEGAKLAMSGAYQLQLALLNRASGPVEHSHGGASHSH